MRYTKLFREEHEGKDGPATTWYSDGVFRYWPADGGIRWAFVWPDDGLGSAHGKMPTLLSAVRTARQWIRERERIKRWILGSVM